MCRIANYHDRTCFGPRQSKPGKETPDPLLVEPIHLFQGALLSASQGRHQVAVDVHTVL
jgi:hypothetical protein